MATSPFEHLAEAWRQGSAEAVARVFAPDATLTQDGVMHSGEAALRRNVEETLRQFPHVQLFVRRAFHDAHEPQWWAAECVQRLSKDGAHWEEVELGMIARLDGDRIAELHIHTDPSTVRMVRSDEPLRPEAWPQAIPPVVRPMTHEEVLATHYRHTREGWAKGNPDVVTSCHAPISLIQTPLEKVRGHDALRIAVKTYAENYGDTQITVHRMIYNSPFLAIQQSWACTNLKTGVRAVDRDINIGVMQDGVFYRWREYYDSRSSAQTREQTVFGRQSEQVY